MEEEILTGGRVTAQVVRRGEFVHRTPCKNAAFVHQVLEFLEEALEADTWETPPAENSGERTAPADCRTDETEDT